MNKWDNRVNQYRNNLGVLVWDDVRREEHQKMVEKILSTFSGSALEIGSGYGRFSDCFTDYTGFDTSEEMIKLGRELHPDKGFTDTLPQRKFDIVFEVISLSSLEMTSLQFIEKYKHLALKVIAVFESDSFIIKPIL